jgi:hypothetical protein
LGDTILPIFAPLIDGRGIRSCHRGGEQKASR